MIGDVPDSLRFDGVPFAFEWLRPPAEWSAGPAPGVGGAPAATHRVIEPKKARPGRTGPQRVGPAREPFARATHRAVVQR